LSVLFLGLAMWLLVHARDRPEATGWMIASGIALALANATAYSSAIFDVVVIVLAFLMAQRPFGAKTAATRSLTLLIVVVVLLGAGLLLGGSSLLHGVDSTTVGRVGSGTSALKVLLEAWSWTGVVLAGALCGVIACWTQRDSADRRWILVVLAVAALLAPLDQAILHTDASLSKHVALGAWLAAIAAGYAVDRVIVAVPAGSTRLTTTCAFAVAMAFPVALGAGQSQQFSTAWPKSASFIAILRPLVGTTAGPVLVEDPSIAEYYLGVSQWTRWSSTRNIVLPSGLSTGGPSKAAGVVGPGNAGTFGAKIASGYFALIALNFADTTVLDHQLRADITQSGHYQLNDPRVVPYGPDPGTDVFGTYIIWLRK
jgi:hypothetical protein